MALSRSVFLYVTKATTVLPGVVPPRVCSFSLALHQGRGRREFPNHQPAQAAKTLRAFRISACHSGTRKRSKDIQFHQRQETTEFSFRNEHSGRNIQRGKRRNTIPWLRSLRHVLNCHGDYTKPLDISQQQAPSDTLCNGI